MDILVLQNSKRLYADKVDTIITDVAHAKALYDAAGDAYLASDKARQAA